ncbi:MAG TPA: hypothetical protein VJQ57_02805, partial [Acidimicrobiia bacterium]|nr:hypothetical protein [Acidimicrobiia bacterium]
MTHPSGQLPHPHPRPDRWIALFLAGPVIWYLFFWVVYLVAEAACVSTLAFTETGGVPTVSLITMALTLVTAIPVVWLMVRAFRKADDNAPYQALIKAGGILGISFFVATVFVGLPAL